MGLRPPVQPISSFDLLFGHQLDAPVLRATLFRLVGGDEVGLAVTVHSQLQHVDSAIQQVIGHRIRTILGQPLIRIRVADGVAVAVHVDDNARIRFQNRYGFIKDGRITHADLVLVELEMHSA